MKLLFVERTIAGISFVNRKSDRKSFLEQKQILLYLALWIRGTKLLLLWCYDRFIHYIKTKKYQLLVLLMKRYFYVHLFSFTACYLVIKTNFVFFSFVSLLHQTVGQFC